MPIYLGNKKVKLYLGNKAIKALYLGNKKVYSYGNTVTYRMDSGVTYTEEVDEGASCLSPKTFTPSKSGWVFVGWRSDSVANGSVLSSKVMGDAPITLYAVFRQTITLSYNGNSATSGSTTAQTSYRYYNNGNAVNPAFTLSANGFAKSGYTFSKWALGSASGTQYAAGASVTLSASTTMYAVWIGQAHSVSPSSATWTKVHQDAWSSANIQKVGDSIQVQVKKSESTGSYGNVIYSADIPTGGCTKVRLKISTSQYGYGSVIVGGTSADLPMNTAATYYYFDVSGSTVSIEINALEGTAYFLTIITLSEIYFYN